MSASSEVVEVVCAVILSDGKVLLCQRAEGKHLAGAWEFPGGKIEEGESAEEALVREIDEELGCEVAVGEALFPVEHQYSEISIRLYSEISIRLRPFLCSVRVGTPRALEHAALAWVGVDELAEQELAEADLEVARQLVCRLGGG